MLSELYRYASDYGLAVLPGYKYKGVKAYIHLSAAGRFVDIDLGSGEKVACPDIGAAALGTDKCNFLVEKADIVLLLDEKRRQKFDFYMSLLARSAEHDARFGLCGAALADPEVLDQIRSKFTGEKLKGGDIVGFKVEGKRLEGTSEYRAWWDQARREYASKPKAGTYTPLCFITGEPTEPVGTVPKVSGLMAVGGHTAGDALLCFDKDSFCSYEFEQAANAAVSEEGIVAVNAALSELIARGPILGGGKFLHWYKEPVPVERDPATLLAFDFGDEADAPVEQQDDEVNRRAENLKATKLVESLRQGSRPEELSNIYYILILGGANGRMVVRSWQQGRYEDLRAAFIAWYDDLRIAMPGQEYSLVAKPIALNIRLIKKSNSARSLNERIASELSGLSDQMLFSIIQNKPLPDEVGARALSYIRSGMMGGGDAQTPAPDCLSCQLIKAWLIRKQRERNEEVTVSEKLEPLSKSVPYQIGRMMAVYAAIQHAAMPDINVSVIERYYGSAITSPALVMGSLSKLCNHHLAKMENQKYANWYRRRQQAISVHIPVCPPKTLSLEEQGQFALGYYQENADIYTKRPKGDASPDAVQEDEGGEDQ